MVSKIGFELFTFPNSYILAPPPKSQKATIEDVEDEEVTAAKKKKKKKKKKSKKKRPEAPEVPSPEPMQSTKPMSAQTSTAPPALAPSTKAPSVTSSANPTLPAYMSTTSLVPSTETAKAQSAHSYLQSLGISDKNKVKTRPDHASLFSQPDTKKGLLSGLSFKKGKEKETEMKEARQSWFSKLSKKTETLMHQLMNTSENEKTGASMKWESFLKVTSVFPWMSEYSN